MNKTRYDDISDAVSETLLFEDERLQATEKFPAIVEKIEKEVGRVVDLEFYSTGHSNDTYLEHLTRSHEYWLRVRLEALDARNRWLFRYYWDGKRWCRTVKRVLYHILKEPRK